MAGPREVLAVRYATRPSTKRELFHRYDAYGEPDAEQALDYWFWVLRYERTTVLVDSGFDPEVGARRGRSLLCPPREALARLGVDAVERVLVTHLHYDHIGNLGAFGAAELLVPERELAFWTGPLAARAQFAEHVEAREIAWLEAARRAGRARTFAGRVELAPGVTALPLAGHSPGQVGVLVEAAERTLLLASDAVHLYEELERERPFSVVADLEEMYRSYDVVRRVCEETGALMVPGHDPATAERFAAVEGVAVRLA